MLFAKVGTDKTVTFGPVLAADGTMSNGALSYTDAMIFKNGVHSALNASAAFTHHYEGVYELLLKAADLDAVGCFEVVLNKNPLAASPVKITVLAANVYDWLFGTVAPTTATPAALATAIWQDATDTDFTAASSIGKSLYTAGVVPGASTGLLISGSNAGTTTLGALTVTGATTLAAITQTGAVSLGATTFASVVVSGTTNLTGDVHFGANWHVVGATQFQGNVTHSGTTTYTGAVLLSDTYTVTGAVLHTGITTYTGAVLYSSTETHTGNIVQNGAASLVVDVHQWLGTACHTATVNGIPIVQLHNSAGTGGVNAPLNFEDLAIVDTTGLVAVPDTQKVDVNTIKTVAVAATATVTFANGTVSTLTTGDIDAQLAAINLDHIAGTATGIPTLPAGTWLDILRSDGTATYDRTTDSLQAIRDRGDAAWITATGFSTHSAANVVTAMGTGTFLTAIPWNASWDAEVQSECDDAITANTLVKRILPGVAGTSTGGGTGTEVFTYGAVVMTVTVDANGNRSVVAFS